MVESGLGHTGGVNDFLDANCIVAPGGEKHQSAMQNERTVIHGTYYTDRYSICKEEKMKSINRNVEDRAKLKNFGEEECEDPGFAG
jgi:hypothetical protein